MKSIHEARKVARTLSKVLGAPIWIARRMDEPEAFSLLTKAEYDVLRGTNYGVHVAEEIIDAAAVCYRTVGI
jgi:hypothetical protein